jgi:Uma2 family endonuclease
MAAGRALMTERTPSMAAGAKLMAACAPSTPEGAPLVAGGAPSMPRAMLHAVMLPAQEQRRRVGLRYAVEPYPASWFIEDEEKVPESRPHHLKGDRLQGLLVGWKVRTGRDVQVGRNLALRWDEEHPGVGVDPDVYVVEPPPPEGDEVYSLRTWLPGRDGGHPHTPGHEPPLLAIEVVSRSRPDKDYSSSPEKYAASGTQELWVFDPYLAGPKARGGPFRLQVWQQNEQGDFERVHAGEGPVRSEALDAWVLVVDEGRSLAIADDEAGTRWWMTPEEMERAEKERERAEKERERVEKEAALRRVAELEAQLAAMRRG